MPVFRADRPRTTRRSPFLTPGLAGLVRWPRLSKTPRNDTLRSLEPAGPATGGSRRFDQRLAQRSEDHCQGSRPTVFRPRLAVHANEESARGERNAQEQHLEALVA